MTALVAGLLLVPVADQVLKLLVRARLGEGALALGRLGEIRRGRGRIWMARLPGGGSLARMWGVWSAAAGGLAGLCAVVPSLGWGAGLLLGGALSHAIETTGRGTIDDYVRLGAWPAFDLADAALVAGAAAFAIAALAALAT